MREWKAAESDAGMRLDVFITAEMGISRGEAQRILEAGSGLVNGRAAKANYRLREGDVVEAQPLEIKESAIVPESIRWTWCTKTPISW